ncbi:WRKY transcription factor 19 [Phytophthora cinnamomi]|uniref:WRKY transcription factor 19 n=1 Tax=Phytophthora cinnamomi TaxID=4785 RepID=UPI00355A72A0|nr:WRKY transcription factor 19 [Phytophthora cinnamomi]
MCRGHGGGRRCQHAGCTKGAQSRSDFCWAHGGGQRCEVKGCMRSRKSKRFCVAHLNWENTAPVAPAPVYEALPRQMELPMPIVPKAVAPVSPTATALNGSPRLPSLLQALRNTQQSSMAVQS